MIAVKCRCGKITYGSEAMAGESAQCMKCGQMVTFGSPRKKPVAAAANAGGSRGGMPSPMAMAGAATATAGSDSGPLAMPAAPVEAPKPKLPRRGVDLFYCVFLLALLPLLSALRDHSDETTKKRLDRTLEANPTLKSRVEGYLLTDGANLDDLIRLLPGQKIDDLAHLPRDSHMHEVYAAVSAGAFFLVVGVLMAWRVTQSWKLILVGLFTATFGVASLFIFQDMFGEYYEGLLHPGEKAGDNLILNLLGFTFGVGLGEELCKALPVIFYIRTHRDASWRGACVWGMASGVGFGVAEGVMYSLRYYNGIAGMEMYLTRFASCAALHAVWAGSVGITLFQGRRAVSKAVNAIIYGDVKEDDFDWEEIIWPALRVLGVAMLLHGVYDTLLTQQMVLPALVIALVSFGWLGFQIESLREEEQKELEENASMEALVAPA